MRLKIEDQAWQSLWRWSFRPALGIAFALNAVAIIETVSSHGERAIDTSRLVTVPLIFAALGLAFWLLKLLFDALKLGAMLGIGYVIVQFSKISAKRKTAKANANLSYKPGRVYPHA